MPENKPDQPKRETPPAVLMAQQALALLRDEDAALAEIVAKTLPRFAMRLAKEGKEVTVEGLLADARQGIDHLLAPPVIPQQKLLTYEEVVAALRVDEEAPAVKEAPVRDPQTLMEAAQGDIATLRRFLKSTSPIDKTELDAALVGILTNTGPSYNTHAGAETIRVLLEHGADVNQKSIHGATPLMFGAETGKVDVLEVLLEHGARLEDKDNRGCTALCFLRALTDDEYIEYHSKFSSLDMAAAFFMVQRGASVDALKEQARNRYEKHIQESAAWIKAAGCPPPVGLSKMDPEFFNEKEFNALVKIVRKEGYAHSSFAVSANRVLFAALGLFGSEQRVLQYLKRWGKAAKQPLHDIIYMMNGAPVKQGVDLKSWSDAIIACGPGMAKLFPFADRLLQPEKSDDGKTWSYQKTRMAVARFAYARAHENLELSAAFCVHAVREDAFNKALDLVQQQKKDMVKNIPDISIDCQEFGMSSAVFRRLAANDFHGLILGQMTDCCQSIGGAGAACAEHGFMSEQSGFYVVEKGGRVIGQTWAWRGNKGELVFDSLETLGRRITSEQWCDIANAFTEALAKDPGNVKAFHIGAGGKTPEGLIRKFRRAAAKPVDYKGYRDSHKQVVIWKR